MGLSAMTEVVIRFLGGHRANDMSSSDLRRRQTEAEKNVNRLRNCMPEKLTTFCKMHLSFLLELDGSKLEEMFLEPVNSEGKKKPTTPFSKKKDRFLDTVVSPLTKESISQIYKLISHLKKSENLKTEGIFRKTGNVTRQRLLKEFILQGAELHLTDSTFSTHDCANVLKQFLSDLPETILLTKHFEAYCQVSEMGCHGYTEKDRLKAKDKQLKALQLLVLLLPRENAILLECLLDLLHSVAAVPDNKMSASSLGVVFAPSLLCPKKISAADMQSKSTNISNAITAMIENAPSLFTIPRELADDIANFWREMEDPNMQVFSDDLADKENLDDDRANINKAKYGSSTAVNTVLTFADRKSPEEFNANQDTQVALAQLYAHVQSMPESAKKKKLLKQFNNASRPASVARKGKHTRSRTFGESLKKHFPILAKHKPRDICDTEDAPLPTVPNTCTRLTFGVAKPLGSDDNNFTTPCTRIRPIMNVSPAVHVVDLGASPCNVKLQKRRSDEHCNADVRDAKIPHILPSTENRYMKSSGISSRKIYPCTPDRHRPFAVVSPITKSISGLPESSKKAMMTPRSRLPMLLLQSPNESYRESVL